MLPWHSWGPDLTLFRITHINHERTQMYHLNLQHGANNVFSITHVSHSFCTIWFQMAINMKMKSSFDALKLHEQQTKELLISWHSKQILTEKREFHARSLVVHSWSPMFFPQKQVDWLTLQGVVPEQTLNFARIFRDPKCQTYEGQAWMHAKEN